MDAISGTKLASYRQGLDAMTKSLPKEGGLKCIVKEERLAETKGGLSDCVSRYGAAIAKGRIRRFGAKISSWKAGRQSESGRKGSEDICTQWQKMLTLNQQGTGSLGSWPLLMGEQGMWGRE